MSRIGKKSIVIPAGVEIKVDGTNINIQGPKGGLTRQFSEAAEFKIENGKVWVSVKNGDNKIWGLCRALLNNMIKGVSAGFETVLEFSGVGYKAQAKPTRQASPGDAGVGQELELSLGYTNPVIIKAPAGVSFQIEKNLIKVMGMDNEAVGQVAARIRAARPPEPYKGTGIKYADEAIIRKAGKKAVTGAG